MGSLAFVVVRSLLYLSHHSLTCSLYVYYIVLTFMLIYSSDAFVLWTLTPCHYLCTVRYVTSDAGCGYPSMHMYRMVSKRLSCYNERNDINTWMKKRKIKCK